MAATRLAFLARLGTITIGVFMLTMGLMSFMKELSAQVASLRTTPLDVRKRMRGHVSRVRTGEARSRTVNRTTAEQDTSQGFSRLG